MHLPSQAPARRRSMEELQEVPGCQLARERSADEEEYEIVDRILVD